MRRIRFLIYFFVNTLWLLPADAGDGYGSCYVKNGVAHALFCSPTSDSGSGTGYVSSFDQDGKELSRDLVIWVGIAIQGCDEVKTVEVESDAVGCFFSLGAKQKSTMTNF